MGFVFSFDMSEDIAHFKDLPEQVQASAECNAVDVIYESFVVTGDQDFGMARLLAHNRLPRGFYWSAAQAVEKYLKAFLLMNGQSVLNLSRGHPLNSLWELATQIDPSLAGIDMLPHPKLQAGLLTPEHIQKFSVEDFIKAIEQHGNPYNAFGVDFNTGCLWALDTFAFRLRERIGALSIDKSFAKVGPDLLKAFEKNNPWFHENGETLSLPSNESPIEYSMSVTKWEIISKNLNNPAYSTAHQWLKTKMKLPK